MHLAAVQCRLHMVSDGETAIWSNGIFEDSVSQCENEERSFFFFGQRRFLGDRWYFGRHKRWKRFDQVYHCLLESFSL